MTFAIPPLPPRHAFIFQANLSGPPSESFQSFLQSPLLGSQIRLIPPKISPPPPLGDKKWPPLKGASHHWFESWFVTFQGSGEYHWLHYQHRWHKLLQRWKWKIWLWQVTILPLFFSLKFLHNSIVFNRLSFSVKGRAGHWGGTGCHSSK